MVKYAAAGALGDAYMENNNVNKAMDSYKEAIGNKDDNLLTPMYLYRLASACEMNNKKDEAKKYYETIKNDYPQSEQARDVEKYLGMMGDLN
eukprot:TRINITY_DN57526_c0_g1_i1.p1 TRINITY_DN57526_c0_g1~~TRINITY_DN57526_c0_g1_i1.p1  ORF type:complete len:101 (+),score=25.74 TRINITY_DN57526_c0_g1_i1:28-303(+)